jgi:hypothetical protein
MRHAASLPFIAPERPACALIPAHRNPPRCEAVRSSSKLSQRAIIRAPSCSSQLPGITSIGFWTGTGTQDWGLEPHRNEGVEITYLETGRMAFSVEANDFELSAGQFGITRPWQLHKLGAPNIGPANCIG